MDPLILSRVQFAITSIFHFFIVPLTLGLGYYVAILETKYVRSGDATYKRMAKFWGKLFLINFAVGVPTGLVMEFQIGMNWSQYSIYVGDVFGVPLAIEALLAFFLESTFLGIWIFGWNRLSKGLHAATIWLVSIGTSLSALWILIANAFMQHPVGYAILDGRAVMVDFAALVFNPKAWIMFEHTLAAGFTTAAFFVLGVSAYHLVRKKEVEFFKRSFQLAAIIAILAVVLVIVGGHFQGLRLLTDQPMKAAASEWIWDTENPASFSIIAMYDKKGEYETWALRIPRALSFLYYFRYGGRSQRDPTDPGRIPGKIWPRQLHPADLGHLLQLPHHGRGGLCHAGAGGLCIVFRGPKKGRSKHPLAWPVCVGDCFALHRQLHSVGS